MWDLIQQGFVVVVLLLMMFGVAVGLCDRGR